MSTLRSQMIRRAAALPQGDPRRRKILAVLRRSGSGNQLWDYLDKAMWKFNWDVAKAVARLAKTSDVDTSEITMGFMNVGSIPVVNAEGQGGMLELREMMVEEAGGGKYRYISYESTIFMNGDRSSRYAIPGLDATAKDIGPKDATKVAAEWWALVVREIKGYGFTLAK